MAQNRPSYQRHSNAKQENGTAATPIEAPKIEPAQLATETSVPRKDTQTNTNQGRNNPRRRQLPQVPSLEWNPHTDNPLIFLQLLHFDFEQANSKNNEAEKNQYLYKILSKANETWHSEISPSTISWVEFEAAFHQQYCSKEVVAAGKSLLAEMTLQNERGLCNISEYIQLARRLPISEDERKNALRDMFSRTTNSFSAVKPWFRDGISFDVISRQVLAQYASN